MEKIKNSVLDVFRNRKTNPANVLGGTVDGNLLLVNIKSTSGPPFTVKLPIQQYDSVKQFLNQIITQIPAGRGDLQSFSTYIDQLFAPDKQTETSDEDKPTVIVPPELSSLLPTKVSDVNLLINNNNKPHPTTGTIIVPHQFSSLLPDKVNDTNLIINNNNKPHPPTGTIIVPHQLSSLLPNKVNDANLIINKPPTKQHSPEIESLSDNDESLGMHLFSGYPFTNKHKNTIPKDVEIIKPIPTHSAVSSANSSLSGYIFVYLDIIAPARVGSILSRVSRIIPDCHERCIHFHNLTYSRVQKTYFEDISILLTDNHGKKINFNPSTVPTYLLLHFKIIPPNAREIRHF